MLLKERNLTAYKMIKDLGLKKSNLYYQLKAKRKWTPFSLYQISKFLNVSIDYLVFSPKREREPHNEAAQIKKKLQSLQRKYYLSTIAKKLNVTDAYVSMLLNGKRKNQELLKKIEKILEE